MLNAECCTLLCPLLRCSFLCSLVHSLLSLPLVLEVVGLVDLYLLFGSPWPKSVRSNLREAARAERKGDFATAEAYYALAEDAARQAASQTGLFSRLGSTPAEVLAKLSAITVGRGAALEASGRYIEAFKTYTAAFEELTRAGALSTEHSVPSVQDEMRAVALAKKLGDLASSEKFVLPSGQTQPDGTPILADMDALADEYYQWAVQHMLPIALPPEVHGARVKAASGGQGVGSDGPEPPQGEVVKLAHPTSYRSEGRAGLKEPVPTGYSPLQHLNVPEWARSTDLGQALEALAGFYSNRGHPERAAQLYNHAISLLRSPLAHASPPPALPLSSPVAQVQLEAVAPDTLSADLDTDTKCHAGLLFYNLVQALLVAADRPWEQQGKTTAEAEQRQTGVRGRAVAAAREGLALVRATEGQVGIPPSPDPVTTVGRGSTAPISTPTAPVPAAPTVSVETLDECKLAEAGLLFALGRAVLSQGGHAVEEAKGLYAAAEAAATPIAARTPLTTEHVISPSPPEDRVGHGTRESATALLSEIRLALDQASAAPAK